MNVISEDYFYTLLHKKKIETDQHTFTRRGFHKYTFAIVVTIALGHRCCRTSQQDVIVVVHVAVVVAVVVVVERFLVVYLCFFAIRFLMFISSRFRHVDSVQVDEAMYLVGKQIL